MNLFHPKKTPFNFDQNRTSLVHHVHQTLPFHLTSIRIEPVWFTILKIVPFNLDHIASNQFGSPNFAIQSRSYSFSIASAPSFCCFSSAKRFNVQIDLHGGAGSTWITMVLWSNYIWLRLWEYRVNIWLI